MVQSCYLCDRKPSKSDNISLHVFPKKVDIRKKWLDACGLSVNDNVKTTYVCSRHFKVEDICKSYIFGTVKSSIKRYAVPTLYLSNPLNIDTINISAPNTPLPEPVDNNIVDDNTILNIVEKNPEKFSKANIVKVQTFNQSRINSNSSYEQANLNQCMENTNLTLRSKDKNTGPENFSKSSIVKVQTSNQSSINSNSSYKQGNLSKCMENTNSTFSSKDKNTAPNTPLSEPEDNNIVDDNNILNIMEKCPEKFSKSIIVKIQTSNQSSINSNSSYKQASLNQCMENTNSTFSSKGENTVTDENNSLNRGHKRKFFEPRYVGEISEIDFSTPKRAKRTLELIKNTDKKKTEKIKVLQRKARKLEKKVECLQDLIDVLMQTYVI